MVSSDFGKLEVRRHLSSGADWAMAGAATALAARPTPAVLRKSRRFMQIPPGIGSCLDDDARRWTALAGAAELVADFSGDLAVDFGMRAVRIGRHHRAAGIRCLANDHV